MNAEEITEEITKLEQSETNWQNIQKLAWLYTVADHLGYTNMVETYDGELGKAISGKNMSKVIAILSEHMQAIKILYPKEYQAVLDRIAEIP